MRVIVADDDVLLREGLAGLLERSGFQVVGQCGDASELIELVREHQPELVTVDIRMPPSHTTEGLEAARAIREEVPENGDPRSLRARRGRARNGPPQQRASASATS